MDPRLKLYEAGYTDLVCVAPPGVPTSENSGLRADDLGKRPGKKGRKGWYGYGWQTEEPTVEDLTRWIEWDANVGLRGTRFPALDIDSTDHMLTRVVKKVALEELGPAPSRIGKAPKELMVYTTDEPFSRVAIEVERNGEIHLVEFLGHGRQYLVYGKHPSGATYAWPQEPLWEVSPSTLTKITGEDVERFLSKLEEKLTSVGVECRRVGRASAVNRSNVDQRHLLAPSIEALRDVVASTPNDHRFSDRDDYIMYGCAIKAAAGEEQEEEGYFIFSGWAESWEDGDNDPDTVRGDWRRMHAPFRIGYDWLLAQAPDEYNGAIHEFEAVPDAVPPAVGDTANHGEIMPVELTDDYLAEELLKAGFADKLKYDYPNGRWHVWDGMRWAHDDGGAHVREVVVGLRHLARKLRARTARLSGKEKQRYNNTINKLGNVSTIRAVTALLESMLSVGTDTFDTAEWELNTPAGIVNLKDGTMREHDPDALHSKMTTVAPAPKGTSATRWERFIDEVTGGDQDLARFMQKQAGYALTGVRREQTLSFVWGPGGNGKSVFIDALMFVLNDYAATAPMDTFAASKGDKHPTDMAGLMGARLVTASETQAGRMWDEQRLKAITGGDRLRARFMRQDFVEFTPRFKLMMVGNHEPQIGNVDDAMRRRIHIVPFTFKPEVPDLKLPETLRNEEAPAILRWMIEGCLAWDKEGLTPPECVLARTEEYFEDEDLVGMWLEESCLFEEDGEMASADAYRSWQIWCGSHGEFAGTQRQFAKLLRTHAAKRPFRKANVGPKERRLKGWRGVRLIDNPNNIRGEI